MKKIIAFLMRAPLYVLLISIGVFLYGCILVLDIYEWATSEEPKYDDYYDELRF